MCKTKEYQSKESSSKSERKITPKLFLKIFFEKIDFKERKCNYQLIHINRDTFI
jgi:hypothetical protein